MIIQIETLGGRLITLSGNATYTESAMGGYKDALIRGYIPVPLRTGLLDAKVKVIGPAGSAWMGRVWEYGSREIKCVGAMNALAAQQIDASYCDTRTREWKPRTLVGVHEAMVPQVDGGVLRIVMKPGYTVLAGSDNGFFRRIPLTTGSRVAFGWTTTSKNWVWRLYRGLLSGASDSTGLEATWTLVWTSSGTSGSCDETISATHDCLMVVVARPTFDATSISESHYITDMKVYGVDGVTTSSGTAIVKDIVTCLDSDDLPAGARYTDNIAEDSTTLDTFWRQGDAATVIKALCDETGYEFGFWRELIGGVEYAVPHYRAIEGVPDYEVTEDGLNVVANITDASLEDMAASVRVYFKYPDGASRYVDVTSSIDNYLTAWGRPRVGVMRLETTSSTIATSAGEAWLSVASSSLKSGTVTVRGNQIRSLRGLSSLPPYIQAGRDILIHTSAGAMMGHIVGASKTGSSVVRLEIDNTPDIAALVRRIVGE